ncbi:MAG: AI-2E family transporter [Bacilli bacterium]
MKDKLNYKLLNILIIVAIVCLLYSISSLWIGIVSNIFKIIAPFALAFALAYVIYPLVKKLIDAGSPKWLAILTVCILGVGSLLVIIILTVPLLYEQILLFLSNISVFLSDLSTKYEINFGSLQSALSDFSTNIISNIGSSISNGAISAVNASVNVVTTGIVVVCAAVYFLIDMNKIRSGVKKYFYEKNRKTASYLKKLDEELTKYLGGMGLNIVIQMIEYTLAFLIIGHPNYLILGILSGISAIIPWFGGFLVAVISLLVSSVISTKMFILTAIICIVCPTLDGNVIGPKVYGKTNSLHPLLVIFAVSAGGIIAGFWGIVLSLPVAIAIKTTYNFYKKDIYKKVRHIKGKKGE